METFTNYSSFEMATPFLTYYYLQVAYNIEALIFLVRQSFTLSFGKGYKYGLQWGWAKSVRGDFNEMMTHHIITNTMLIGSMILKITRTGSIVLVLHDISDIPIDLAKIFNALKMERCTVFFYVTMCSTWIYLRLYIYPRVIYNTYVDLEGYSDILGGNRPLFYFLKGTFIVLMSSLLVLHIVWFGIFIKIGYVLVMKKECHDLSEEKKGEEYYNTLSQARKEDKEEEEEEEEENSEKALSEEEEGIDISLEADASKKMV